MTQALPVGAFSPADLQPLAAVAASTNDQVAAAVAAARAAQPAWAATPLPERQAKMIAFARRMLERSDEAAKVLSQETGRGVTECLMSELVGAMEFAKAAVRASSKALATEKVPLSMLDYPGKKAFIEAVPRGVVGIIAPWNYPMGNFWKSLFPALLSGNAVVMKPSEHTPRSGTFIKAVLDELLPAGLVQLVQGDGRVGAALLESGIDAIVFTGSVPTGKKIAQRAGELLIPCSVELGGKDAAIVLADCDLDRTVAGIAQWGFHNAGQNCAAIERVYVEAAIADAFIAKLAKAAAKLTVAPGAGPTDLGPIQNPAQLDLIERHVADAKAKGAKVLCGGARTGNGLGFQATVIECPGDDFQVVRDETFGPVLAVMRVKDAEEGVKRANASRYGLNGSVWTRDIARGTALARQLEVGVALVNNHAIVGILPELPWTGVKDTGPGVASSRHAYPTFVRRRALFVDSSSKPDPWWMPANEDLVGLAQALVKRGLGSMTVLLKLGGLASARQKAIKAFYRDA